MNNPYSAYQKNQVQTLSQEKLVLMLYDGAVRFITKGIKAIEERNIEEANNNLLRSQNIMAELMSGINWEAGQIAGQFFQLYEYMHRRLVEANVKKNVEPAKEVLEMVKELRDTWAQMLKENKGSKDYSIPKQSVSVSG
ncbi:MAG: flagellar export chaperone FliS [Thermoanaerobacteraceae bacterium]|nr:flagellar export chaperone FliS [Thermoanaerobacteraceae bacterium]